MSLLHLRHRGRGYNYNRCGGQSTPFLAHQRQQKCRGVGGNIFPNFKDQNYHYRMKSCVFDDDVDDDDGEGITVISLYQLLEVELVSPLYHKIIAVKKDEKISYEQREYLRI